jgi:hypothetical protein
MRLSLHEYPGIVATCVEPELCKKNTPETPVAGTVWTVSPWLLEPIVARAGRLAYETLVFRHCYYEGLEENQCDVEVAIGQGTDPAGWASFKYALSGSIRVPPPQFLWELLTEVAQVALHDPNGDGSPDLAEGDTPGVDANGKALLAFTPKFTLHGVPLGISGAELIAQIRPSLQAQASTLSDKILGRYWKNNDALDFFYSRAAPGGPPYLFFVAESDARPDPTNPDKPKEYRYQRPGFFTTPDLDESNKASTKVIEGVPDAVHEKYLLPPGKTTLYMQDDEDAIYEVEFYVPADDASEITADVRRL